jgi:hypothetical protein
MRWKLPAILALLGLAALLRRDPASTHLNPPRPVRAANVPLEVAPERASVAPDALASIESDPGRLEEFRSRIRARDPEAHLLLARAKTDRLLDDLASGRRSMEETALRDWLWSSPVAVERFRLRGDRGALASLWRERFEADLPERYQTLVDGLSEHAILSAYQNLAPSEQLEIQTLLLRDVSVARRGGPALNRNRQRLLDYIVDRLAPLAASRP